ncbi:MAG: HD domain-containing protein, partial [Candidatus Omnitrophica bacterium]|nr:HD domain-containing protein [Candidatus Omnitrophota bacterium]
DFEEFASGKRKLGGRHVDIHGKDKEEFLTANQALPLPEGVKLENPFLASAMVLIVAAAAFGAPQAAIIAALAVGARIISLIFNNKILPILRLRLISSEISPYLLFGLVVVAIKLFGKFSCGEIILPEYSGLKLLSFIPVAMTTAKGFSKKDILAWIAQSPVPLSRQELIDLGATKTERNVIKRIIAGLIRNKKIILLFANRLILTSQLKVLREKGRIFTLRDKDWREIYISAQDLLEQKEKGDLVEVTIIAGEEKVYEYVFKQDALSHEKAGRIFRVYGEQLASGKFEKSYVTKDVQEALVKNNEAIRGIDNEGREIYIFAETIEHPRHKAATRRWFIQRLIDKVSEGKQDTSIIQTAYVVASSYYGEKKSSATGEHLIDDAIAFAYTVSEIAGQNITARMIAAALLIDVPEENRGEIKRTDRKTDELLAGLKQVTEILYRPPLKDAYHVNKFKYMVVKSIGDSVELLFLVLGYKLHLLKTLPDEAKLKLYDEMTLIYAAIAEELGLRPLSDEFRDLAARTEKTQYEEFLNQIQETLGMSQDEAEQYIAGLKERIEGALRNAGIEAEVRGVSKTVYSVMRKLRYRPEYRGLGVKELKDLLRFMVITKSWADAWAANVVLCGKAEDGLPVLGELDRFKDRISFIGSNAEQPRLQCNFRHARLDQPDQSIVIEVQILTRGAYDYYNFGPTAHTIYEARLRDQRHTQVKLAKMTADLENNLGEYRRARGIDQWNFVRWRYWPQGPGQEYCEKIIRIPSDSGTVLDLVCNWKVELFSHFKQAYHLVNGKKDRISFGYKPGNAEVI